MVRAEWFRGMLVAIQYGILVLPRISADAEDWNIPFILRRCETRSCTPREEHKFMIFACKAPRRLLALWGLTCIIIRLHTKLQFVPRRSQSVSIINKTVNPVYKTVVKMKGREHRLDVPPPPHIILNYQPCLVCPSAENNATPIPRGGGIVCILEFRIFFKICRFFVGTEITDDLYKAAICRWVSRFRRFEIL